MEYINSPAAKAVKLPFSQAVRVGDVLYLSGALGNKPGTLELVPGGMAAEARQPWKTSAPSCGKTASRSATYSSAR